MYLKLNLKAAHSLAVSDSADAANSHSESAADSESESEFPRSGCQWQDHWHWQSPPGPGSPAPAGAAGAGTAAHWHCGTLRLRLRVRVHFKPELNSAAGGLSPGISSLSCQLQCHWQCRLQPESRWDRDVQCSGHHGEFGIYRHSGSAPVQISWHATLLVILLRLCHTCTTTSMYWAAVGTLPWAVQVTPLPTNTLTGAPY